jgi:hypothetical protein
MLDFTKWGWIKSRFELTVKKANKLAYAK